MIVRKIEKIRSQNGMSGQRITLHKKVVKKDKYGILINHLFFIGIIFKIHKKYTIEFRTEIEIFDNFLDAASALLSNSTL